MIYFNVSDAISGIAENQAYPIIKKHVQNQFGKKHQILLLLLLLLLMQLLLLRSIFR
jgi:hypothetical protein